LIGSITTIMPSGADPRWVI